MHQIVCLGTWVLVDDVAMENSMDKDGELAGDGCDGLGLADPEGEPSN